MPQHLLAAGVATGIGSLPHRDAAVAATLVLRCLPELPAAPQLPLRTPFEQMLPQWARAIPGVEIAEDGSLRVGDLPESGGRLNVEFDRTAHGGLLTFLDVAATQPVPPRAIKAQITGPLTIGVALVDAGWAPEPAFELAARAARAWVVEVERLVEARLPGAGLVLFLDEPELVRWRDGNAPLDREAATDMLSSALATAGCVTGVHVCGRGDVRLALDAGPDVLGLEVATLRLDDAVSLARYLDGDGWIAWGAIPTDRPVGEQPAPLWKALLDTWCELTRRGCDPLRLRGQAMVSPACGLAGHGASQAERAMRLARELGNRVQDQAAATKLTIGA